MKARELTGEIVLPVEFEAPFGVGRGVKAADVRAEDTEVLDRLRAYVAAHEDWYIGAVKVEHLDRDGDGAIDTARWLVYFHRTEV